MYHIIIHVDKLKQVKSEETIIKRLKYADHLASDNISGEYTNLEISTWQSRFLRRQWRFDPRPAWPKLSWQKRTINVIRLIFFLMNDGVFRFNNDCNYE